MGLSIIKHDKLAKFFGYFPDEAAHEVCFNCLRRARESNTKEATCQDGQQIRNGQRRKDQHQETDDQVGQHSSQHERRQQRTGVHMQRQEGPRAANKVCSNCRRWTDSTKDTANACQDDNYMIRPPPKPTPNHHESNKRVFMNFNLSMLTFADHFPFRYEA